MRTKKPEILKSNAEECCRRAALVTDPLVRHDLLALAAQWLDLATVQEELEARRERLNGFISGIKSLPEASTKREAWRRAQGKALEVAMLGGTLERTLGILISTATDVIGEGVRAAFYIANPAGTTLHHVVGMPAAYAEAVDGFKIGADSLACGLATHTGRPVLTSDVTTDQRWIPWRSMAQKFDYRGCWSFPIRSGMRNGSFAIYSRGAREATSADVNFAELVTKTAAILIDRHIHGKQR